MAGSGNKASDQDADDETRQCGFCGKVGPAEDFFARTKRFCSHSCCSKHNRMAPAERKAHAESLGIEYQPSPSPRVRKHRPKVPLEKTKSLLRKSANSTPVKSKTKTPKATKPKPAKRGRPPKATNGSSKRSLTGQTPPSLKIPSSSRTKTQTARSSKKHTSSTSKAAGTKTTSSSSKGAGSSKKSKGRGTHSSSSTQARSAAPAPQEHQQVFTTEYVSRMRVDDAVNLEDYIPITDRWINRYNEPTQVPSGYLDKVDREDPVDVGRAHRLSEYSRPKAYHRMKDNDDNVFGAYDMDQEDEVWLKLAQDQVDPTMTHDHVERAVFAFERAAFELLRNQPKSIEYDASVRCDVCGQLESEEGNEILFCDGCDVAVHQVCYGVSSIPTGSWYCQACVRRPGQTTPCALCPNLGGALKQTTNPRQWAHLSCAIWTPEATIENTETMEPVDIRGVPKERYNLQCSVCESKNGSCVQCIVPTCTTAFHVTCAMRESLRMDVVIPTDGDVTRLAYCRRHAHLKRTDPDGAVVQHVAHPNAKDNTVDGSCDAYHKIKLDELELDPDIPPETLQSIFSYWVLKRRRQHDRPLIRQFTPKPPPRSQAVKANDPRLLRHRLQAERLSLEKLRSLCEQVRRRETRKRELLCVLRREFTLSAESHRQTLGLDGNELCGPQSRWNTSSTRRRWEIHGLEERPLQSRPADKNLLKQRLFELIEKVKGHRAAKAFLFPVNTDAYPDYRRLIKTPIDISTIYSRVLADHYSTFQAFSDDVGLVFTNCYNYNAKESDVWKQAKRLQKFFDKQATKYVAELEEASRSDADDSPDDDNDDNSDENAEDDCTQQQGSDSDEQDHDDDDDSDDHEAEDADPSVANDSDDAARAGTDSAEDEPDAEDDNGAQLEETGSIDDDDDSDREDDVAEDNADESFASDDDDDIESGSEASPYRSKSSGKRRRHTSSSDDDFESPRRPALSKRAKALETEAARLKPRFTCTECQKPFRSSARLERHLKSHQRRRSRRR
eukprot:TRINITY_DN7998_c0_g1_i1.p1 TRINITY_DN7998_c0_g1~~TRINITY_DN7998_c0_g1_i1.p1  ORF type:complete len:1010 (+),score=268.66 TRINITY_DN7998_c0_g1_i1:278-3307(+)